MLNRRDPARFDVERVWFVIFTMINILKVHSSGKSLLGGGA